MKNQTITKDFNSSIVRPKDSYSKAYLTNKKAIKRYYDSNRESIREYMRGYMAKRRLKESNRMDELDRIRIRRYLDGKVKYSANSIEMLRSTRSQFAVTNGFMNEEDLMNSLNKKGCSMDHVIPLSWFTDNQKYYEFRFRHYNLRVVSSKINRSKHSWVDEESNIFKWVIAQMELELTDKLPARKRSPIVKKNLKEIKRLEKLMLATSTSSSSNN